MDASSRLVALISAAYGLLFAFAVLAKADGWRAWSRAMGTFVPGRPRIAAAAVIVVPLVEALVAALAFALPKLGLLAAGAVLAAFALVVAVLQSRHRGEECNCFGALATSRIDPMLIVRNALAAAVALTVGIASRGTDVQPLPATSVLALILVGSVLAIGLEFRNLLRLREQRLSA
jgi:hypothetical protein